MLAPARFLTCYNIYWLSARGSSTRSPTPARHSDPTDPPPDTPYFDGDPMALHTFFAAFEALPTPPAQRAAALLRYVALGIAAEWTRYFKGATLQDYDALKEGVCVLYLGQRRPRKHRVRELEALVRERPVNLECVEEVAAWLYENADLTAEEVEEYRVVAEGRGRVRVRGKQRKALGVQGAEKRPLEEGGPRKEEGGQMANEEVGGVAKRLRRVLESQDVQAPREQSGTAGVMAVKRHRSVSELRTSSKTRKRSASGQRRRRRLQA
ncbi:hypothetical protein BV25DRAFT_1831268 [Artomyces pyxidatus]|uniref:Uncharacterized protein n=1 Tax=Artomyces pyxidatus TaxID=48021 RepID=A0ACB8SLN6_9AGAM|nr:hypothetical protein BV25DRAFT_1831268 [Artomyces pyxidatus]